MENGECARPKNGAYMDVEDTAPASPTSARGLGSGPLPGCQGFTRPGL